MQDSDGFLRAAPLGHGVSAIRSAEPLAAQQPRLRSRPRDRDDPDGARQERFRYHREARPATAAPLVGETLPLWGQGIDLARAVAPVTTQTIQVTP